MTHIEAHSQRGVVTARRRRWRPLFVLLLLVIGVVGLAPRIERGDLRIYFHPEAQYTAVRLDGVRVGGWVADGPGGSSSGPIVVYPLVAVEGQSGPRLLWFRPLAVPLSQTYSDEVNAALR